MNPKNSGYPAPGYNNWCLCAVSAKWVNEWILDGQLKEKNEPLIDTSSSGTKAKNKTLKTSVQYGIFGVKRRLI